MKEKEKADDIWAYWTLWQQLLLPQMEKFIKLITLYWKLIFIIDPAQEHLVEA